MARQIHYDRARHDLAVSFRGTDNELRPLLSAAIPDGKSVQLSADNGLTQLYIVKSWAGMQIGTFRVDTTSTDQGIWLASSIVTSVLHSTSIIPFVFGKGSPQALGSYKSATERAREAVDRFHNLRV